MKGMKIIGCAGALALLVAATGASAQEGEAMKSILGAIGNVIDRLAYGAVFDFLHVHVGSFSWYVFNVADAAIVAGVVGLLYDSFVLEKRRSLRPARQADA